MKQRNVNIIVNIIPLLLSWIVLSCFLFCTSTSFSFVNGFTSLDTSRQLVQSRIHHNNHNYGNNCMWNYNDNDFVLYNHFPLFSTRLVAAAVCNDRKPKHLLHTSTRLSFRLQSTTQSINIYNNDNKMNNNNNNNNNNNHSYYQIQIEYCPGCRWGLRAFWMAQELLMVYGNDDGASIGSTKSNSVLQSVTLIPTREPIEGGRYRIHYMSSSSSSSSSTNNSKRLWDRKEQGRFPTVEEIIQLINVENNNNNISEPIIINDEKVADVTTSISIPKLMRNTDNDSSNIMLSPNIGIVYNNNYLVRANYYCMELLSTFSDEINSISFIPITPSSTTSTTGSTFIVTLDEGRIILWDKKSTSTSTSTGQDQNKQQDDQQQIIFPETKVLKQLVRDNIIPTKDLGHSDVVKSSNSISSSAGNTTTTTTPIVVEDELDNEQAEEARRFFGVM